MLSETGRVKFTARRKLDTGDATDFVIPLDQEIDMIWGIRARDYTWQQHDFMSNF